MRLWPFGKKNIPLSQRSFDAAQGGRLTNDWVTTISSGDAEIRGSLRTLRSRSRDLERNNDYIRSFLRECEINIIGKGINFQSQVKVGKKQLKLDEKTNKLIQNKWNEWTKARRCHVAGQISFRGIERLMVRSTARDGEFIVRMVNNKFGDSKIPLGLELIEADRLDDLYNDMADNGNEIRMGVELDKWSRPVAYYFYQYHPGDFPFAGMKVTVGGRRMRVPAEDIVHTFSMERANLTRGFPWVVSAVMKLRHMQGYEEAEVIAARAAASVMGFIQTEEGELQGDGVQDQERITEFQPGTIKKLNVGETMNVPDMKRPGGQFDAFTKAMLRGVAAGIGLSYESLSKDYSQSNFSSSRLSLLNERELWRILQQYFIESFHQRIFERWLDMAVLSGQISLPDYELETDKYHDVRWRPRGWPWVDPQKEVNANRDAIMGGLTSISKIVEAEGDDVDDLFDEIARERDLAKEKGLIFDTDAIHGLKPGNEPRPGLYTSAEGPQAEPDNASQGSGK